MYCFLVFVLRVYSVSLETRNGVDETLENKVNDTCHIYVGPTIKYNEGDVTVNVL